MKTILAAVDFSPITPVVMQEACGLAKALGAKLVLVSVAVPASIPAGPAALTLMAEIDTINTAVRKSTQRKLRSLKVSPQAEGLSVETECFTGNPGGCITDYAGKIHPDYIVIGSHGHTAFYDLVIGSTAQLVLRRAKCRVVVVPPLDPKTRK